MRKTNYLAVTVLLSSLILAGCATNGAHAGKEEFCSLDKYQRISTLVRDNWDAFAKFSRQDFSERIADSFTPDKNLFLSSVEESFYSATPIDLFFTINKAIETKDKISVSLSWEKKVADRDTGVLTMIEGEGSIVFINQNDQWLIYKIDETSIFTL